MFTNINAVKDGVGGTVLRSTRTKNAIAIGLAGTLAIASVVPAWAQTKGIASGIGNAPGWQQNYYGASSAYPNGYASRLYASVAPDGYQGPGCFVVTDQTRGIRFWRPSC